MLFRKVAIRPSSSFLRFALAGLLVAGVAASLAHAATTTYTSPYAGGTIAPGDTVVLNDGATITGAIIDNGTLQFNQTSGTLTMSSTLTGSGTLSLTNAGTLMLTGTTVSVGIGLDMTTTVDSGRLLIGINGGRTLYLGNTNGGVGTLSINGGYVGNGSSYLGYGAGGQALVTVSSGTWSNGSFTYVGWDGSAMLDVPGGSVSGVACSIGRNAGSVGSVTVLGGTMSYTSTLTVGDGGTGSLTIGSGGLVAVRGNVVRGAAGTISLNAGGTLQIGTGTTTGVLLGGTGSLANNGTVVFNRSNASTYTGVLSGSGAVAKLGTGQFTLGGANSYTGLTTISGGTLALSGSGSIGTGGLNLGTTGSPGVFDLAGLTAGTHLLPATGNLAGVGTLSGSGKSLAVLGSLTPGNSAGTITVGTGLSLDLSNSGSSVFEIASPAYTAGTFDLVNGSGSVVFGGILNLAFSGGSYADGTDVLQLFTNTGGRSGNFSAVNATGLASGQSATFNPLTGFIAVVPEPSTCASLIAGAVVAGMMRWRNRQAAKEIVDGRDVR
jgi:autotransporter-associated beta strand protein/T5SS/PEP-CTERM-associated repeat protein